MVFAIRQDRLGFLLIDQIKSKVGGHIAEREGHQGPLLQAVIHTFGVAIRNVVRQCNLDDPIRLSSLQLFTPKLQADERSQMKQIGVRDEFADGRPNGSASAASAIANLISFSHCAGVRGKGRFIEDSACGCRLSFSSR